MTTPTYKNISFLNDDRNKQILIAVDPVTDDDVGDPTLKEKLKDYGRKRAKLEKMKLAQTFANFNSRLASRIEQCGTHLSFALYQNVKDGGQMRRLEHADFCKTRKFCPQCAANYSAEISADILGRYHKLNDIRKKNGRSPFRLIFLTVTVKNVPLTDLRRTLSAMSRAWQRFVNTRRFKKAIVGGWLRGVEYLGDNTEPGMAHPHFHAILLVTESYFKKDYISHADWAAMWRAAARLDYDPQVNIKRVTPRTKKDGTKKSAASSAAAEVSKYVVSTVSIEKMSPENVEELYNQTKGLRAFALGGLIATVEPDPPEEIDEDLWQYLYTEIWNWNRSQYVMRHVEYTQEHMPHVVQKPGTAAALTPA